ncbi:protein SET DOMAIN GROUP 40 [Impatiens glandulifera]|uniref:protein SET DOMAIN GROUP 40 n=1 Tax=Impatiens glandulifera TaxID=253017 RepID=UPI001FB138E1|nr:protein SET DOMAIN GROUP 40 [Impatiens glandulifera]
MESFLRWAAELGISDSPQNEQSPSQNPSFSCIGKSLCVEYFADAGGRGLAAVRKLCKGELILRVPKSALMTRDRLLKDQRLSASVNRYPSLSSTQVFATCLLYEVNKGKKSGWFPYLMHLPRSYDILATFGEFEIQSLQVDDGIWSAEKAIQKAKLDWQEATSLMKDLGFKPSLQTFKAWLWASATISSRTLHIPWDNAGCLCPVGDLFNYAAPGLEVIDDPSLEIISSIEGHTAVELHIQGGDCDEQRLTDGGYAEDIASYCFYARRNYEKGEQVLLGYGTYTNLELLEHYGFLLDNNPNDKVYIPIDSEIYSLCPWSKDLMCIEPNGKPSFALLFSVRLWLIPPFERKSQMQLAYSGSQLSVHNEINTMRWLKSKCEVAVNSFSSSVDEDRLLLVEMDEVINKEVGSKAYYDFMEARGLLSGKKDCSEKLQCLQGIRCMNRWKLAVNWRLNYKRCLEDCICYCNEVISNLIY